MAFYDPARYHAPPGGLRSVTPDTSLTSALESMSRYDLNQLPVVSNNHLEGVLSRSDVLSYLQTHAELQRELAPPKSNR